MTAAPKIIEGTWEEVLQRANELVGHHLKVIVFDDGTIPYDHPAFDTSPAAIEAWIKQFREDVESRPEIRLGDDSREAAYGEHLDRQL